MKYWFRRRIWRMMTWIRRKQKILKLKIEEIEREEWENDSSSDRY